MQYPLLPGLTWDGQMYRNADMGTVEALLPTGGYPTAHAPALLELPDGSLLCAWFGGTYEGSADIRIICSRLDRDSGKWTEPVDISGDPNRSEKNPSLFYGPDNAVWAIYTAQLDRQPGKDNMQYTSQIRCQRSTDGGRTWGEYETLFAREGSFCRQPIQVLSNGRWIFGNWLCSDAEDGLSGDPTAFQISDDQGKTWRQVDMPRSNGRVHANVVELTAGIWRPSCAAARRTSSTAASPSTGASRGASRCPRRCPTTTPPSARCALSPGACASPTTPPARPIRSRARPRGRGCAARRPWRSPRTAASPSRSSAGWSAARASWARKTAPTTSSTSIPISCRAATTCCIWPMPPTPARASSALK